MTDKDFSSRLRYAMQYSGMRATDLSELTGISRATISEYMSGRYVPKQRNLGRLAKVLHVQPTFLMGLTEFSPAEKPSFAEKPEAVELNTQEKLMLSRYRALNDDQRKVVDALMSGLSPYDAARRAAHKRLDEKLDAENNDSHD